MTANPPFGQQFQNFQITNNGVVTTSTTNPAQITVDGQIGITANCATAADVRIQVNTNPPNIGATVGVRAWDQR